MESKTEDEIYCPECGKPIKRRTVVCPLCGVQVAKLATEEQPITIRIARVKSKAAAIILAVFFGYWSWLYTYKMDSRKFWFFFCLMLVSAVGVVMSIDSSLELTNAGTWIWVYFLVSIASYIWALTNSISRPDSFYENYGGL